MNPFIDRTAITCREDKYGGVIIDDATVTQPLEEFEKSLIKMISDQTGRTLIWITLPIAKSGYIPVLTKHGFTFYDCSENSLILLKKLTQNPVIPTATNHTIGVGAFVRDGDNMLVVKDRIYRKYKLPGGYIDKEENISQAVAREVSEETGIDVQLKSIVSMGHFSPCQFGESNMYLVCKAVPLSATINITDSQEILEARWMPIDEYMNAEDIHPYNKKIVIAAMETRGIRVERCDFFTTLNSRHELFF
ncbi:NUDIX domain-containing protein [Desulfobulbus sp. TB]|nr:NUDIX domain-containing protein [Desulfobulbus sp. TB]